MGVLEYLRLLRLSESWQNVSLDEKDRRDLTIATSLLLRDGHEPTDVDDRKAVEGLNSLLEPNRTKVRVSFTRIAMKNGHVRWQVAMKSTDTDGVETSDLNVWAPTLVSGMIIIILRMLGIG